MGMAQCTRYVIDNLSYFRQVPAFQLSMLKPLLVSLITLNFATNANSKVHAEMDRL